MDKLSTVAIDKPSDTLIDILRERQERAGLSEQDFAELLGVGKATWILIRQRNTKPGLKFIAAVIRKFPDLEDLVVAFLKDEPGLMDLWAQPIPA